MEQAVGSQGPVRIHFHLHRLGLADLKRGRGRHFAVSRCSSPRLQQLAVVQHTTSRPECCVASLQADGLARAGGLDGRSECVDSTRLEVRLPHRTRIWCRQRRRRRRRRERGGTLSSQCKGREVAILLLIVIQQARQAQSPNSRLQAHRRQPCEPSLPAQSCCSPSVACTPPVQHGYPYNWRVRPSAEEVQGGHTSASRRLCPKTIH